MQGQQQPCVHRVPSKLSCSSRCQPVKAPQNPIICYPHPPPPKRKKTPPLLNSFLAVIIQSKPGQKGLLLVEFISSFHLSLLTVLSMSCKFGLHLLQIDKNLGFWRGGLYLLFPIFSPPFSSSSPPLFFPPLFF